MDAHQANAHPLLSCGGGTEGLAVLPQPGEMGEKAKQTLVSRLLKLPGALGQGQQVPPPPRPVAHGIKDAQQIGAVIHMPQQLVAAQLPRQVPQPVQLV